MAVIISGGAYLGRYLDQANNKPVFTILFSLLAIAASFYYVFKGVNKKWIKENTQP